MDRELNKDEIKFLKRVNKNKFVIDSNVLGSYFNKEVFEDDNKKHLKHINMDNVDFGYLYDKRYFRLDFIAINQKYKDVKITPEGKSILDKENKDINPKLKFWLPTGISIVALLASIAAILVSALLK